MAPKVRESWAETNEPGLFVDVGWHQRSDAPLLDRSDPGLSGMERFWGGQARGTQISDDEGAIIVSKLQDHFDWSFVPKALEFVDHWKAHPP